MEEIKTLKELVLKTWHTKPLHLWLVVFANLYYTWKIEEGSDSVQAEWWAMMYTHRISRLTEKEIRQEGLNLCDTIIKYASYA